MLDFIGMNEQCFGFLLSNFYNYAPTHALHVSLKRFRGSDWMLNLHDIHTMPVGDVIKNILASNYKWMGSLPVCPSIISTTVHSIDFTLGGCIADDRRKCSVESEVVWMSLYVCSHCKQQYRSQAISLFRTGMFRTGTAKVHVMSVGLYNAGTRLRDINPMMAWPKRHRALGDNSERQLQQGLILFCHSGSLFFSCLI